MSSPRVIVVGAGFGGIAAAIELRRHGFTDVTILERGAGPGGTWRDNTYPGAACDVPSHLYSFLLCAAARLVAAVLAAGRAAALRRGGDPRARRRRARRRERRG